jgi:3-phenylpropionate/trans-cinnamate dioxygenase ferredoxin subunit
MKYVTVAKAVDIPIGNHKKVSADGKSILLANINGKVFAINDKCPHMGGSLSEGIIEDGAIVCPRHHARFDLATGKNLGNAKILFLGIKVKDATSYEVKTENGELQVGID